MNSYDSAFLALISACGLLTWQQYNKKNEMSLDDKVLTQQNAVTPRAKAEASQFTRLFLTVYSLVMASDWLQGPYVYSLYKDQFGLQERIVGLLFVTGFLSGAISGYFHGRRTACLIFCVTYSVSCFSTLVPSLPVLFFGRVFGGLSTSVMYSAFESWMVTEFHKRHIDQSGTSLSSMFGITTTLNSIVAILSGVFSEWLVEVTHTKRAPFMASAGLLTIAFWIIWAYWINPPFPPILPLLILENYGNSHDVDPNPANITPQSILKTILTDKRILTLGLASCFFEGSMYLFVFFWTPALKAAFNPSTLSLPLGMIFASFMASVMLGSLLFNLLISKYQLLSPSHLLTIIFAMASSSLLTPLLSRNESLTFWSFCVFELCVGMYWPSVGYLKGRFVEDGVRARVYGMLRIPLNIFVVVALGVMREGEAYRNAVFLVCNGLLVVTSGIFYLIVWE
ncbi:Molybdate-anion transporter [Lachnellula hyalina]|uniref:Molybdate-anion transporter n=1 Tax=Lachnellula hyalina TaxID=1316788 RepID=A0A8H8TTV5_9HELO|nr:Molybdate-anion transporter [Lachnellula hyalina]TVY22179.1 Molybdate-anion transporter [Lachnellula hyalina]